MSKSPDGAVSGDTPDSKFVEELQELLNKYSKENGSDTPDFVLAEFLTAVLHNFNYAVRYRENSKVPF